jgi:hypothetical protein
MRTQARRSGLSDKIVAVPHGRELYREHCQDEDGNRYTVVVSRPYPDLGITHYELDDGTPVRFVDDCLFEIEATGTVLTRCE